MKIERYGLTVWWFLAPMSLIIGGVGEIADWADCFLAFLLVVWTLAPLDRISSGKFRARPIGFFLGFLLILVRGYFNFKIAGDLFFLIGGFLLGVFPLCLHYRQRTLGYWSSLFSAILIALAGVIGGGEVIEHFLYLLFLSALVYALNAENLRTTAGKSGTHDSRLPKGYFRQLTYHLALGMSVGAIIFFIFPRASLWTSPFSLRGRDKQTGYNETVTLDGQAIVDEVQTISFTVANNQEDGDDRLSWLERNASSLYFRGSTVDSFDGRTWTSTMEVYMPFGGSKDLRTTKHHSPKSKSLTIFREPTTSQVLFYPSVLVNIAGPRQLLGGIFFNPTGSVRRGYDRLTRFSYDVTVTEPRISENALSLSVRSIVQRGRVEDERSLASYRRDDLHKYLQIPASVKESGYFKKWKEEVLGQEKNLDLGNLLGILKRHFRENFEATLLSEHSQEGALESFLTLNRKGHCEYFATATVLLLRSLGIPSRVVLGYRGGDYNPVSGTLEVREKNAHAWTEIFVTGGGWMRVDPTPTTLVPTPSTAFSQLRFYYSAMKFWFHTYVVDYNSDTQRQIASTLRRVTERTDEDWAPTWKEIGRIFLWGVPSLLIFGLIWYFSRKVRWKQQGFFLPSYYRHFLRIAEKAGFVREKGETYRMFHQRMIQEGFDAGVLIELTQVLEKQLYSGKPASALELQSLRAHLKELRQKLKMQKAA